MQAGVDRTVIPEGSLPKKGKSERLIGAEDWRIEISRAITGYGNGCLHEGMLIISTAAAFWFR